MTLTEIEQICKEVTDELTNLRFGKVFQLDPSSIAIDFFPHSGRYLYINFGSRSGAMYLIRRKLKDLERNSAHPAPFTIALKKSLTGMTLDRVTQVAPGAIMIGFSGDGGVERFLAAQFTPHRPNLFLLSEGLTIIDSARADSDEGKGVGDKYLPPDRDSFGKEPTRDFGSGSLSDFLDEQDRAKEEDQRFQDLAMEARHELNAKIRKRIKLSANLESDLAKHGEPEQWKRYGDLILSNIANIRRRGDSFVVTDYYDPALPEVEVPAEMNASPAEAAEYYFKRYAKARNGVTAIDQRLASVQAEIEALNLRLRDLEAAINAGDEAALASFISSKKSATPVSRPKKEAVPVRGARRFISSDGFDILVGKKAVDNDHLTFRVARSLDTWLHAADYPGSHVVVRNPTKKDLPMKTLLEAAELAAFYSDARDLPKAAVRYTLKKFVNKPRKAAPGLVSLSSFKTILVEPKVGAASLAQPT